MDTTPPADSPDENPVPHGGIPVPPEPEVPGFRVDRLLGVGGSAAVWLVRDDDGAPFALKVPAGGGEGVLSAFEARREVNVLARLEHPHLLQVHAVVETNQGAGLLSGYAAGGSAAGLVAARGRVQPGEAVSILVGIARALAYVHSRGAAHGDVSPGNILFTSEGRPLLADFGSGRLLGEPGGQRLGTPGFSAPENTGDSAPGLGAAADMYALAAVGWFLLTGCVPPPRRDRPPLSILVPGVGRELPALLEAGLAEEPARRPTADDFAAAAYRGASAVPVDLLAAVHPDVRPELLTRRTGSAGSGTGKRKRWRRRRGASQGVAGRGRGRGRGRGWGRGRGRGREPGDSAGREWPLPRRRDDRPTGRRRRSGNPSSGSRVLPVAATVVVTAVLILAGIALAAPDLLQARGTAADAREGSSSGSPGTVRGPSAPPGSGPSPAVPAAPSAPAVPAVPAAPAAPGTMPGTGVPGRDDSGTGVPARSVESLRAETAAADPAQALPALAELRSRAFTNADPALLEYVNVPGSEAHRADHEQVDRLAVQGHALAGLVTEVALVDGPGTVRSGEAAPRDQPAVGGPLPATAAAELRVRMQVSGYTEIDSAGAVLRHGQAQQQEVLVVLVRNEGIWRISRILAPQ